VNRSEAGGSALEDDVAKVVTLAEDAANLVLALIFMGDDQGANVLFGHHGYGVKDRAVIRNGIDLGSFTAQYLFNGSHWLPPGNFSV
jgi:hypothetical protein